MERYDVIEQIATYLPAVGRLVRPSSGDLALGTCFVISRSAGNKAVIITTSHAIVSRREASEAEAIFHESRVLGSGIKALPMKPVRVKLRPDRLFFTSAPDAVARMPLEQRRLHAESVGYTVVGCDVVGVDGVSSIAALKPLTLPLIRSKIPSVTVGETHLIVGFRDGAQRCTLIYQVEETFTGHSSYASHPSQNFTFESGGAVFNEASEFIGIHHEAGADNHCIHIASVVDHLYGSLVLGRIGIPVLAVDPENPNAVPREHDGSLTGIELLSRREKNPHGAGDVVEDLAVVEYRREQLKVKPRETLVIRTDAEVWKELYSDETYDSLVLMLHAFHDHRPMLKRIIDEMASRKHRDDMWRLARLGGVGILLEALATVPYDEDLMTAGTTLVGRASLHTENQEALSKYSGIQTILSVVQEYRNTPSVAQWCIYALLNLCEEQCGQARENTASVVGYNGIRTVVWTMERFPAQRHIARWGSLLIGWLVQHNKTNFDLALDCNACSVIGAILSKHRDDEFVLFGATFALWKLCEQELFVSAADFFVKIEVIRALRILFQQHSPADEPLTLLQAARALECIMTLVPEAIEDAVAEDMEAAISNSALCHMTDTKLHAVIARVMRLMGVNDPGATHAHLQLSAP